MNKKLDKLKPKPQLRIFLMGGTKDSINIIKFIKETYNSSYILTTTTTDYGGKLAKEAGSDDVTDNPLSKSEILDLLSNYFNEYGFNVLIDATHPFASHVTSTAIEASKIANMPYIRFERPKFHCPNFKSNNIDNIYYVDSFEEAGDILSTNFSGQNILHLAGVNTIELILSSLKSEINKKNFFVRVLPVKSSIEKCNGLGIYGEHIIAMQGVFSKKFNKSLMEELNIKVIITKESGNIGGVPSKIAAASELDISVILVNRPKIDNLENEDIVNDIEQLKISLEHILKHS